jgi:hypothetical protein
MQSKTIINLLGNEDVIKFIGLHIKDDVNKLALDAKKYPEIDIKAISTLISLYKKAALKLPEHYKIRAALNPKSYEQSTSEAVAKFKAEIMGLENKKIINITGGIGIDDWAMAKYALKIDSCDMDAEIHEMAVFNNTLFKNEKIERHLIDGITFVNSSKKADAVYADPDRRPGHGRVFRLEDSQPDILSNMEMLLDKADKVWLKISPMADITYLKKSIPSIKEIYVISWMGEVKEILLCCDKNENALKKLVAVNIGSQKTSTFEKECNPKPASFGNAGNYLYEPNKSIIKAGLSSEYSSFLGLKMLSIHSHFFISDNLLPDFDGRRFEIIERLAYKPKIIKTYFETNGIKQANITTRNFRETPENLKKRFGLKDGGTTTLCFSIDNEGNNWLFHCQQL